MCEYLSARKWANIMTGADHDRSIPEQELITMLSRMRPVAITVTPHRTLDGTTVYAWRAGESSGTHPTLLGAAQAALEDTMVALAYTPVSPEAHLTSADFPPKWSPF